MKALRNGPCAATRFLGDLQRDNDPLVYAQEYLAEFVDWSGVAFFSREKLLVEIDRFPFRRGAINVFAVIDTAVQDRHRQRRHRCDVLCTKTNFGKIPAFHFGLGYRSDRRREFSRSGCQGVPGFSKRWRGSAGRAKGSDGRLH